MSDDPASKAPAQDITSTDTDSEGTVQENPAVRIFDITPDLNISPAKDETENVAATANPEIVPPITVVEPIVEPVATPPLEKTEEKIVPPVAQFGPANPPAKTVGVSAFPTSNDLNQNTNPLYAPATLQSEVSAIKITSAPKIPDKPWEAKVGAKIKPLKTYESDVAEAVAKKRLSTTSFVIAEEKKKEEMKRIPIKPVNITANVEKNSTLPIGVEPKSFQRVLEEEPVVQKNPHRVRNWILGLISLIFICGGSFAAYYLYLRSPVAPANPSTNDLQPSQLTFKASLIPTDSKAILNIDGKNRNGIISVIKAESEKPQDEKSIKEIILTRTTDGTIRQVPATEIIGYAGISTPDLFSRSLSSDWLLGIYSGSGEQKYPIVITTNNFFQNTFAGLIQWEKTITADLKDFLYYSPNNDANSTSTVSSEFTLRGQYKDRIIKNRDVREYVAENGHIIFLYSFISNDKLVLTNSEEALEEVITRLERSSSLR